MVATTSRPSTDPPGACFETSESRDSFRITRTAALGGIDFFRAPWLWSASLQGVQKSSKLSTRTSRAARCFAFACGGGIRAATVRPRTRLSRRGLRAFTELDGQESQRKTPPGCVFPPFISGPPPAPRAGAASSEPPPPAPTRGRESADDARDDERTASDAFVGSAAASRDVTSRRLSRARLRGCLDPSTRAPSPGAPRLRSPPRRSPTATLVSSLLSIAQTSSTTWRRSRATARALRSSSCS